MRIEPQRTLALGAWFVLAIAGQGVLAAPSESRRPNVVIILADDKC